MQLVARHVIKPNHRFYREADRLSWLCKNLYNSANYIYRQNIFASQQTNALAVYRALKTSPDYKALPAVAQSTIGLAIEAWTSYYLAVRNYQECPTKFKVAPKIPHYQGSRERKREDRRYVAVFNCQAVSKKALKKGYARPSGLPAAQKTGKKIANLWHKRNCKVDYYLHTTSSAIIKELVNHQIGLLVIGWNHDFKDGIKTGKVNNQSFACIPIADSCKCCSIKEKLHELKLC